MTPQTPKFSLMKLIPITVLVTVLSQFNMLWYYNKFNFSPITYFEPHEIVIASVKDFILVAIFTVISLQIMMVYVLPLFDGKRGNYQKITFREYNASFKNNQIFWFCVLILLFAIFIVDCYWPIISKQNSIYKVLWIWVFIITLITLTNAKFTWHTYFRDYRARMLKEYFPNVDPMVFLCVSFLLISSIEFSDGKQSYIMKHNPYKGTVLITDENEVIKCTSKVLFIGKSQKFYFIFNTPDSSIRIVSRDKLKKEIIKIDKNVDFFYRF